MNAPVEFGIRIKVDGGQASVDSIDKISDANARAGVAAEAAAQRMSAAQKELGNYSSQAWMSASAAMAKNADATVVASDQLQRLIDKYDPLGAKLRALKSDFESLNKAASSAAIPGNLDAAADAAYRSLQKQIQATQKLMDTAGGGVWQQTMHGLKQVGDTAEHAHDQMASGAQKSAFATAGATRELIVLGHEAMTGNFSRMPGSVMVLAERMGNLHALLNPTTMGIVAAGVAVFGLATAVSRGHDEMVAMDNALAVTSNYAGMTRDSIDALAETMTKTKEVTIGHAKEIVTELVASGRIGQQSIAQVAQLASDFAKATGKDIEKITPELIKLFSDPAKGAEELNKSMHFLTVTDQEHITTLERLGRTQEAQQMLAEKITNQIPKQRDNLTDLAKAYNSVADAAGRFVNYLKSFREKQTPGEELKDWEAYVQRVNDAVQKGQIKQGDASENLRYAQERIAALRGVVAGEQQAAKASAEAAAANQLQAQSWDAVKKASQLYHAQELQDQMKLIQQLKPATSEQANAKLDAERRVAKEIQDLYRSMGAEDRQLAQQRAASEEQLEQLRIKGEEDQIKTELDLGKITKEQFDLKMTNVKLEENAAKQMYERQVLRIGGLSKTEEQAHQLRLKQLQEEWNYIEQAGVNKQLVDEKKAYDDIVKAVVDTGNAELKRLNDAIRAQKEHNAEIGLTAEGKAAVKRAIEDETAAQLANDAALLQSLLDEQQFDEKSRAVYEIRLKLLQDEIAKRRELAGLMGQASVLEAEAKSAAEAKKLATDVGNTLSDAIVNGGDHAAQRLRSIFGRLVLNPIIQPIGNMIGSAVSNIVYGGNSAMSGVSMLTSGYNMMSGMSNPGLASYMSSLGYANGGGTAINSAVHFSDAAFDAGYSSAANGYQVMPTGGIGQYIPVVGGALSAYGVAQKYGPIGGFVAGAGSVALGGAISGMAAGTGAMAGAGSALAALGPWGWAALGAAAILGGMDDGPEEHTRLRFASNNQAGNISINERGNEGKDWTYIGPSSSSALGTFGVNSTFWMDPNQPVVQQFMQSVQQTDNMLAKFMSASEVSNVSSYLTAKTSLAETGPEGSNPNATGQLDQVFTERIKNIFEGVESGLSSLVDGFKGSSQDLATEAAALLQARQHLAEYADVFGQAVTLQDLAALKQESESAAGAIARLTSEFQVTNGIAELFGRDVFGVGLASKDARERLINLSGGIDALASGTAFFSQNFLTEAERMAPVIRQVSDTMTSLGYAGVDTKQEFADLVRGLDLSSEAGAQLYAKLMQIAPAFLQAANYAEAAANQAIENAKRISDQRTDLQAQIMQLEGNAAGALAAQRAKELAAMDASLRPLQQRIYDLQDEAQARQDAQSTVDTARSALQDAYNRESSALQEVIDRSTNYAKSLREVRDQLKLGNLSYMSPAEKYYELQRQFNDVSARAAGGDTSAMEQLQSIAQQYAEANRAYNASSEAGAREAARIAEALSIAADRADVQVTLAQAQLSALNQLVSGDLQLNQTMISVRDALNNLHASQAASAGSHAGSYVGSLGPAGGGAGWTNNSAYSHPSGVVVGPNDSALMQAAKLVYQSATGGVSTSQFNAGAAAVGGDIYGATGWNGDPASFRARWGFAEGGIFTNGVVTQPTMFDMAEMGEDGPEAIVPLVKTAKGLGIRSVGGADNSALIAKLNEVLIELRAANEHHDVLDRIAAALESGQMQSKDDMRMMLQHLAVIMSKKVATA